MHKNPTQLCSKLSPGEEWAAFAIDKPLSSMDSHFLSNYLIFFLQWRVFTASQSLLLWKVNFYLFYRGGDDHTVWGEDVEFFVLCITFHSFKLFLSLFVNHLCMYSVTSILRLSRILWQALICFLKLIFSEGCREIFYPICCCLSLFFIFLIFFSLLFLFLTFTVFILKSLTNSFFFLRVKGSLVMSSPE